MKEVALFCPKKRASENQTKPHHDTLEAKRRALLLGAEPRHQVAGQFCCSLVFGLSSVLLPIRLRGGEAVNSREMGVS